VALINSYLLVKSSASTIKENPQYVSPAPEPFRTNEKADPVISTNELVTILGAITGLASSIILSSLSEADI
jgi:hypothetical protein